jgi:hypothetical protein
MGFIERPKMLYIFDVPLFMTKMFNHSLYVGNNPV